MIRINDSTHVAKIAVTDLSAIEEQLVTTLLAVMPNFIILIRDKSFMLQNTQQFKAMDKDKMSYMWLVLKGINTGPQN